MNIALASRATISGMTRYVFYPENSPDVMPLARARKAAREHGAEVVRALDGGMLLEVDPSHVKAVARALTGWRYAIEQRTMRIPERAPLQRTRRSVG